MLIFPELFSHKSTRALRSRAEILSRQIRKRNEHFLGHFLYCCKAIIIAIPPMGLCQACAYHLPLSDVGPQRRRVVAASLLSHQLLKSNEHLNNSFVTVRVQMFCALQLAMILARSYAFGSAAVSACGAGPELSETDFS